MPGRWAGTGSEVRGGDTPGVLPGAMGTDGWPGFFLTGPRVKRLYGGAGLCNAGDTRELPVTDDNDLQGKNLQCHWEIISRGNSGIGVGPQASEPLQSSSTALHGISAAPG